MQAVRVHAPGGPDVLTLEDLDVPAPGEGQALVKVAAAGLNYLDVQYRTGKVPARAPFTIGVEAAGRVVGVGPGVTEVVPGDRVAWAMHLGAHAGYAVVPAGRLVGVPAAIDLRTAASALLQGLSAHYLTHSTNALASGHVALVHAAAGGTGQMIVRVARRLGARVIATVGSEAKVDEARAAGAGDVLVAGRQDVVAEVRRLTDGRGVDVVYDSIGRDTFDTSLDCLRRRGLLALFGFSSGPVAPFDPALLGVKGSLFLTRPGLNQHIVTRDELLWRAGDLFRWLAEGAVTVRVGATYGLAEAAAAHAALEGRRTTGKVLFEVG
jgi:NADPH2:quinone reductase